MLKQTKLNGKQVQNDDREEQQQKQQKRQISKQMDGVHRAHENNCNIVEPPCIGRKTINNVNMSL